MAAKPSRIKRITKPDDAPTAGVAITVTPGRNTHVGILYRDADDDVWLLHLAFHHDLQNVPFDSEYLCVDPGLEDEDAEAIAAHCRLIARDQPTIAFAIHFNPQALFGQSGKKVVLLNEGKGLNCSTFVLAVFQTAGTQLIDKAGWPERPEDINWHKRLIDWLKDRASKEYVRRVAKDIGCARIRPEEVAGACMETTLPATFQVCEHYSHEVLAKISAHTRRTVRTNWV